MKNTNQEERDAFERKLIDEVEGWYQGRGSGHHKYQDAINSL